MSTIGNLGKNCEQFIKVSSSVLKKEGGSACKLATESMPNVSKDIEEITAGGMKAAQPEADVFEVSASKKRVGQTLPIKNEASVQTEAKPLLLTYDKYKSLPAEVNARLPQKLQNTKLGEQFAKSAEEIRGLDHEEGRVFDAYGNTIAKTEVGSQALCEITEGDALKICKYRRKNIGIGAIHSHPDEAPFSGGDLHQLRWNKKTSIMVITPSGGYSFLQRTANSHFGDFALGTISAIESNDVLLISKMYREGKTNVEITQKLGEFRHEQLKRFADHYGLIYEYKPGKIDPSKVFDWKNMHYDKKVKDTLIKGNGLTEDQAELLLQKIDKTPIEKFLIDYSDYPHFS